jgi:hypothetical protein
MGDLFEQGDIIEGIASRRERDNATAASAAYLNIRVEATRSLLAPDARQYAVDTDTGKDV